MDTSRSSSQPAGHIAVEGHAGVLVARIDGGPHALFDPEIAKQLKELVNRASAAMTSRSCCMNRTSTRVAATRRRGSEVTPWL
jgi:hypothetical protein